MKAIACSLWLVAFTTVLAQPPTLPEIQVGLPVEPADNRWMVGQLVLFLTLIANLLFNLYDSRQKRLREVAVEKVKAEQLENEAKRVEAKLQREAERLAQQRAEDRADAEQKRQWDLQNAERQRRWDLEDRARARAELVGKLDHNTAISLNAAEEGRTAAQESRKAAEQANHVQEKFNELARAIDAVSGRASTTEAEATASLPAIKDIVADTNTRVRGLENEASHG